MTNTVINASNKYVKTSQRRQIRNVYMVTNLPIVLPLHVKTHEQLIGIMVIATKGVAIGTIRRKGR